LGKKTNNTILVMLVSAVLNMNVFANIYQQGGCFGGGIFDGRPTFCGRIEAKQKLRLTLKSTMFMNIKRESPCGLSTKK